MTTPPGWEWQDDLDHRRWWADYDRRVAELNDQHEEIEMGLTARRPEGGGDFAPPPAGTHVARCYRIVDLGTQDNPFPPHKPHRQVYLTWELCNEPMEDGRPFSIGGFYTNSLHEKAKLLHHLEAWRGRPFSEQELQGFELENVLGAPCMLNVIHERKDNDIRAKISGVMAMPKGQKAPALINDAFLYSLATNEHWDDLPEWLQERVNKSHELAGVPATAPDQHPNAPGYGIPESDLDDIDDSIPF